MRFMPVDRLPSVAAAATLDTLFLRHCVFAAADFHAPSMLMPLMPASYAAAA